MMKKIVPFLLIALLVSADLDAFAKQGRGRGRGGSDNSGIGQRIKDNFDHNFASSNSAVYALTDANQIVKMEYPTLEKTNTVTLPEGFDGDRIAVVDDGSSVHVTVYGQFENSIAVLSFDEDLNSEGIATFLDSDDDGECDDDSDDDDDDGEGDDD